MRHITLRALLALLASFALGGCVMERTVTDSAGNVIYQEPEVHTPFESTEKRQAEVERKSAELGW